MEHEERNDKVRAKMLAEINNIEAFIVDRTLAQLLEDRMCQNAIDNFLDGNRRKDKASFRRFFDCLRETG